MTDIRVSVFFPLLVIVFCLRYGVDIGLAFGAIFFFSVLAHEMGHVLAARMSGGSGDEILIWPLGGLAFVQPAPTFSSRILTSAAGPLTNFAICLITLPAVWNSPHRQESLNPFVMPISEFSEQVLSDVLVLVFAANFVLFLINMIPVFPLDCGRIVQTILSSKFGSETGTGWYLRVGLVSAFLMLLVGLAMDSTWIVFIGAMVLVLNMQESMQHRTGEVYDDSFMGYDFSQGYTSLEKIELQRPERPPGFFKRWREKRRTDRLQKTRQKEEEVERQLDALLEKVHLHGIESLSPTERRMLDRASARYRDRGNQPER